MSGQLHKYTAPSAKLLDKGLAVPIMAKPNIDQLDENAELMQAIAKQVFDDVKS